MSGVGSISNAYSASVSASQGVQRPEGPGSGEMPEEMKAQLDESLAEAGVDEETRAALEEDLEAAMTELFESGSADPSTVQETVDSVFAEYGLDAQEFMPPPPPPGGGGPGGPPPSEDSSATSEDYTSQLEELLASIQESSDDDSAQAAKQVSQYVTDALFGYDAEA